MATDDAVSNDDDAATGATTSNTDAPTGDTSSPTRPLAEPASASRVARRARFILWGVFGLLLIAVGAIAAFANSDPDPSVTGVLLIVVGSVVMLVAFAFDQTDRVLRKENTYLQRSVELKEAVKDVKGPTDFKGLIELNQKQMANYDEIARSQAKGAHRSASLAMGVGLLILAAGGATAILAGADAVKYSATVISSVGVATSGYVAKTFLRVRNSASRQMAFYFQQPLVQNYLLTAERLATQLPDDRQTEQIVEILKAALAQASSASAPTRDQD